MKGERARGGGWDDDGTGQTSDKAINNAQVAVLHGSARHPSGIDQGIPPGRGDWNIYRHDHSLLKVRRRGMVFALPPAQSTSTPAERLESIASHLGAATMADKLKVVVCRDLGPDVMPFLHSTPQLDVVVWPHNKACERKWLLENARGASGILVMLADKVDEELLDTAGPKLRVVSTMSVGYEHADLKALLTRGVRFGYTPDVLTDAVADLSVMLALMAGRNAKETTEVVQSGQWPNFVWSPFAFCGPQLSAISPDSTRSAITSSTRTAGFIGFGRIAQATLARLVPFGFTRCLYAGNARTPPNPTADAALAARFGVREVRRVGLPELARESDAVFVLAPGGAATHHVVDEAFLRGMKRTAVLVNTARGTLVDSDALAKALQEGWLYGAGIDVVEGEPNVGLDHPLVKAPRCIVLPHIGSATNEARLGMATLAAKNLLAGLFGQEMPAELNTSH